MESNVSSHFAYLEEQFPVIIHLDLDCFYAQVESVRLGLDPSTPLCVQQWDGVIAVNYAAREYGISRHERVEKVKEKCPSCVLVHVETVGFPDQSSSGEKCSDPGDSSIHRKSETKVSLDRYREASLKIFQLLSSFSECCEKASIDEAYLDVSQQVEDILNATKDQHNNIGSILERLNMKEEERAYYFETVFEPFGKQELHLSQRLLIGCAIAAKIRYAIYSRFFYTCSAGIAENKLLAKLGSSLNKPNRQTLISPNAVPCLLQNLPLRKLRGLGGKLGTRIEERTNARTVKEAQNLTLESWNEIVGRENAKWIYNLVRGIDYSPVNARGITKSILAAKTFKAECSWQGMEKWIKLLAYELCERLRKDEAMNCRRPTNFIVHYSSGGYVSSSKSIPFPNERDRVSSLSKNAMKMLQTASNFCFPCKRLSFSVSKFQNISSDATSIAAFLKRQEIHRTSELPNESMETSSSSKLSEARAEGTLSDLHKSSFEECKIVELEPNEEEDYILAQRMQEEEWLKFRNKRGYFYDDRMGIRKKKKGESQTLDHFFHK
ncbi:hypothetical protein GpartN1_g3128.t1 [Galdieria partita]|uniref:DNA polymerase eta n=1 Tax=Galdieria partita TaxID=83374 RepID=A0A9C7PXJ7_9RHOD|nr:hypothetical protein GpartN1_g3128.t1 [Galdieria partita]